MFTVVFFYLRRWLTWDERYFWAEWTVISARLAVRVSGWKRAWSVGLSSVGCNSWTTRSHVLLVPLLLVPLRQQHRHYYFLDFPRKFRIRPLWWLWNSSGFYSCQSRHFPVDASFLIFLPHRMHRVYRRGRLSDWSTSQWNNLDKRHFDSSSHNWQLWIHQYVESTVYPHFAVQVFPKSPLKRHGHAI